MGACVHFSRSLPSNSWWQTMAGWQVLSRPSAAEGGGHRPAFTGTATQPYSATEVDGWQHKAQPGVSKPGRSTCGQFLFGGLANRSKSNDGTPGDKPVFLVAQNNLCAAIFFVGMSRLV